MADDVPRARIAADPETDSALEVDLEEPSLASLRSSILQHQHENGRTYHSMSAGKYVYPNDEAEAERLDLQDFVFFASWNYRRYLCPAAEKAKRVLDIGTGTGIWAVEFADAHPETEVIGVDLSPIQPSFIPPNCSFELDDLEKEWTWRKKFDYIFSRMMTGSFVDMAAIMQKIYDNLEPGGWFEIQDLTLPVRSDDGTLKEDSALLRWSYGILEASAKFGRALNNPHDYKPMMEKIGFVDVDEKYAVWPSNSWPKDPLLKEVGRMNLANSDQGLEGLSLALYTRALGYSKEETLLLCADVRKDLRNRNIHAYWELMGVYGRKPGGKDEKAPPAPAPAAPAEDPTEASGS